MKKVGFLFGAGAELSYGMPSGGKFALDIFREKVDDAKQDFREMRAKIVDSTAYATNWLPKDYKTRNIQSYGKKVLDMIIKDTVRNNRDKIISSINSLENFSDRLIKDMKFGDEFGKSAMKKLVLKELGKNYNDINVVHELSYNNLFKNGNALFENKIFAVLIFYYNSFEGFSNPKDKELLGKLILAIMQLQIGALSENITRETGDSVLSKQELPLDIFDELGGSLKVDYETAGVEGLRTLSEIELEDNQHPIVKLAYKMVEDIYANVLDYKTLIDSNWRYLYNPKKEWGKFTKIVVFLYTVQRYIKRNAANLSEDRGGYYNELVELRKLKKVDITTIATTNYSPFIGEVLGDVVYLNGGTAIYYDPYMNKIIDVKEDINKEDYHILVPLIFTQSGTKPMTSVSMLLKYAEFYKKLKNSDYICVIGFGFNLDDEHINGILRTLIDEDNKTLVVIDVDNGEESTTREESLARKLRVTKEENIKYIIVSSDRKGDNKMWYELLIDMID